MDVEENPLLKRAYWRFHERIKPNSTILPINERIRNKHYYVFQCKMTMKLYDPIGNEHTVEYVARRKPPAITSGWKELLQFYRIDRPYIMEFIYVGMTTFIIKIKNEAGWEIAYKQTSETPTAGPSQIPYVMEIPHTLTGPQASRSHLDIPHEAAKYIRKHGKEPWKLVGPSRSIIECKVIIPNVKDREYVAKFGSGWKTFCLKNKLKEHDKLNLKFTNPFIRKVIVEYM